MNDPFFGGIPSGAAPAQPRRHTVRFTVPGFPMLAAAGLTALIALASTLPGHAQVPGIISYHGVIQANGNQYNGSGHFKFALVNDGLPDPITYWSNDGTLDGSEPANHVVVEVDKAVFTAALGDTSLPNMVAIPTTVFANSAVYLRIWFRESNDNGPFTQLSPDQRITSVGYAMMSANVPNGAVGTNQLADGSITTPKLADNAVTSVKIAAPAIHTTHLGNGVVTTAKIADGAATTEKLATAAVTSEKLAPGSVGAIQIADNSVTSADIVDILALRELVLETAAGLNRIELSGTGDSGVLRMNHGSIGQFLEVLGTTSGGQFKLFDKLGGLLTGQTTVELGSATTGGYARLYQDDGTAGVHLNGQNGDLPGGTILVYRSSGLGVVVQGQLGSGGGQVEVRDSVSDPRVQLRGANGIVQLLNEGGATVTLKATGDAGELVALTRLGVATSVDASVLQASLGRDDNGGLIRTRDENNDTTALIGAGTQGGFMRLYRGGASSEGVVLDGDDGSGGAISVKDSNGTSTIRLIGAQTSDTGSRIELSQANGTVTTVLDGEVGNGGGGYLQLRKGDGTGTITLDADSGGAGRITTQVLQITGGSDLSERFEIHAVGGALEPGMVVCIDPNNPTHLTPSRAAYDRTVAGVISGAGGVKPGMLMGQAGTAADGQHPVALTGRVYARVDATFGAIRPGDLITTSPTPGHGMKVSDHARANGAILGKAMTALPEGQGLVLILVSLQ